MHNELEKSYRPQGALVSRRGFLLGSAALGAVGAFGMLSSGGLIQRALAATADASAQRNDDNARFMRVSAFVTGNKPLDAVIGKRFGKALAKRDAAFNTDVMQLLSFIEARKLADMDAFVAVASGTPTTAGTPTTPTTVAGTDSDATAMKKLYATATRIVSAWYLGVVGDGADSELITYADALMYAPTKGILAVPTYGPGPLAWGAKPIAPTALASASTQATIARRMVGVIPTSQV
jgi:hypothetical protein